MSDLLSDIVEVVVSSDVVAISQAGFRSLLVLGEFATSVFPERIRRYGSVQGVAEDFPTTSAIYKAAVVAFSDQTQHVDVVCVGRRVPGTAQVYEVTVTAPTAGAGTIELSVDGITFAGAEIPAGTSNNDAAVLLAAAANESTEHPFVATVGTNVVTLTSQYGANDYDVASVVTGTNTAAAVAEDTAPVASSETVAEALNAIELVDGDWFGLAMVSTRTADITAAASWLQSSVTRRLGHFRGNDPEGDGLLDATSTTDPGYLLKASAYGQVAMFFHPEPWKFLDVAVLGGRLGVDPDVASTTWAHYQVAGIAPYKLTETQRATLANKNVNHYVVAGGRGTILEGVLADGEYIDIAVSEAWLQARLRERVFGRIAGAVAGGGKLPYDDDGAKVLEAELRGQISDAQNAGHITRDPEPVFTTPRRATINSQTALTRTYPPLLCDATWAGAIHRARFRVNVTV